MTREYLRLKNPKGIYIAVPHFDKDHFHIHVCASGIEYKTGKSMRLSKSNLSKLKKNIQQYQLERFPELSKSVVAHRKKEKLKSPDREYQVKYRTGRESIKETVKALLEDCYNKAISKYTFLKILNTSGLKTYERGGKTTGVILNNYKFRFSRMGFTDDKLVILDRIRRKESVLENIRTKEKRKSLER